MESRIGWLGGSAAEQLRVDETLISVDTYTGEEVRLTPDQLAIVEACEQDSETSMCDLMNWLGTESVEIVEAFLADLKNQS
jgi:hypothetical protein